MKTWFGLDSFSLWLLRKLLSAWTRTVLLPEDLGTLGIDGTTPACYVLEMRSLSNLLVVEQECTRARLPRPLAKLHSPPRGGGPALRERRSIFSLSAVQRRLLTRSSSRSAPPRLTNVIAAVRDDPAFDVLLVPVSVFWGRAPEKEYGLLRSLFLDNWGRRGRLRKFFTILLHGRNTFVQIGKPLSVRRFLDETRDESLDESRTVRKLYRVLRVHFRRTRAAAIGPDLSHRRTLVDTLIGATAVQRAIRADAHEQEHSLERSSATARRYAYEIAANYSYPLMPVMDRLLTRLWNRLYDGVVINHIETVREIAPGKGVVYLPCHRSHIDYLLLSYVLYRNGFAPPHIAAGINLNLPLIGPVLRWGGAFFLRRTFQGNRLYATVFHEYLCSNLAKGFPLEYFIEGGRSRTGRALKPKPGMLAMTVRAALRYPERDVVFVPVYIGYEKLIEGETYISELSGKPKQKESIGALLRSLRELRSEFGKVYLNFGAPIALNELLDRAHPGWRAQAGDPDDRPEWLIGAVDQLARQAITGINDAVAVNPVNLLGVALLSTPRQALAEATLAGQVELYAELLRRLRYSERITVTETGGVAMIEHGEKLGLVTRHAHTLGDLISAAGDKASLLTYFRNNILHLLALPSLLARCFANNHTLDDDNVLRLVRLVYPYIRSELFTRWADDEIDGASKAVIDALLELGLLRRIESTHELARPPATSARALQLSVLGNAILPNLERYYLTLALLRGRAAGQVTQTQLEELCRLVAQRMALLQGFNSPEFFDKALFGNFIQTLAERGLLNIDADSGLLTLDESVDASNEDVNLLLSQEVRHSILQLTRV